MFDAIAEYDRMEEIREILADSEHLQVLSDLQAMEDYLEQERIEENGNRVESLAYHRVLKIMMDHVDELSERKQEILHLKFWDDCTDQEIGERLKLNPDQVARRMKGALRSLKESILRTMQAEYGLGKKDVLCAIYG